MKIEVQNLQKSFGEKRVLTDINLTAESGSALGLLGRNGAGKTTTIRIIMGVFYPDSGSVLVDGSPIDRNQIQIGYLPEERGLYPKKPILEQLIYFGILRGLSKKQAGLSAEKWLNRMGMAEYKNKKLETLSKGNQQKIQLAATLLCDPQLIILDEPFSGLDPVNAMLLKDVIKEMIAEGAAVIFSSHQMNYIEEFCDQIAILNTGKIVLSGNIHDIKRSYPRNKISIISNEFQKLAPFIIQNFGSMIESLEKEEKENKIMLKLKEEKTKNRILSEILKNDFDIDSFMIAEPSLNDIFVEYTEAGI